MTHLNIERVGLDEVTVTRPLKDSVVITREQCHEALAEIEAEGWTLISSLIVEKEDVEALLEKMEGGAMDRFDILMEKLNR